MKLHLVRDYQTDGITIGRIFNPLDDFHLQTVELPWKDNQRRISCIPPGTYVCVRDFYNKGGYEAFEIVNVPDRSEIKIHVANYANDVLGCIGIGEKRYTEGDGMVTNSRVSYKKFMQYLKDEESFELVISDL